MSLLDFLYARFHADNVALQKHLDQRSDSLAAQLTAISRKVDQVAVSQADFDAAFDVFEAAFTTSEQNDQASLTEIQATVTAILAKVPPGVDLSAEVARLQAVSDKRAADAAALKTAADAIQALGATPPGP